jgi:hypothetical protein
VNPRWLLPEIKSDSLGMLQNVHCADLISYTAPSYDSLQENKRHVFSFSSTCAVVEKKIFENWSILGSFCPALKTPGGQEP